MKKGVVGIVVGLVVVLAGAFILFKGKTSPETSNSAEVAANVVSIDSLAFAPSSLTVKKGTTVTWTNNDAPQHDVVSDSDSPMKGLQSALLSKGQSYSFTFDTPGVYKYHCTPHPFMKASITVTE
jgi:amicyanin